MLTSSILRRLSLALLIAPLCWALSGCKKEDDNPLLKCRPQGGGGIGVPNPRTVMFWIDHDFQCGQPRLIKIRNTETNSEVYEGSTYAYITRFFATQPSCGTSGAITIKVSKGYEYEYTVACTGREWKAKFTADCNDDCIAIQLQ